VAAAFDDFGALRLNPLDGIPAEITGGTRLGDERFEVLTARRPVAEAAIAGVAERTEGLDIRRGAPVASLTVANGAGAAPRILGVVTEDGEAIAADLVVDAGGRRSPLPRWLGEHGVTVPENVEDCGFVYYGRHFRSPDGTVPPAFGGLLHAYDSVSTLTLPADNGTWGVGVVAASHDAEMRKLKDVDTWSKVVASYPLVAHWADGEPLGDVDVIAKIEDRDRTFAVDGRPVATGLAPVGDAWACTNPSVGRGASIGLMHAAALRDTIAEHGLDDPDAFAIAWHEATERVVRPYYDETLVFDRHRLAQIDAQIEGRTYDPDDPGWRLGQALGAAAPKDPDLLRGSLDIAMILDLGADVMARPGFVERLLEVADPDPEPPPGPSRAELLALVGS
jgi:2-polyprenyl-6-methoxyphenol hydroxylase-like FAD-dependent oxidoreductase